MHGPDRRAARISRNLRVNQTEAEKRLWFNLRNRQIVDKFVRQEPVLGYVCDFVSREKKLVIEVDGGQHSESNADIIRDRALNAVGYRVLGFWNNEVLNNLDGVLVTIVSELRRERPLTLDRLPR